MEKKEYIEPSMIVRVVNMNTSILAASPGGNDEIGSQEELSKENFMMDETGTQTSLHINDVWED